MKVLWAQSPQQCLQIVATLAPVKAWHPNTVRTLLSRLVDKKAIVGNRKHRQTWFSPMFSEKDFLGAESRHFLERLFGGSARTFLNHMLESQALSEAELGELRKLLCSKAT